MSEPKIDAKLRSPLKVYRISERSSEATKKVLEEAMNALPALSFERKNITFSITDVINEEGGRALVVL